MSLDVLERSQSSEALSTRQWQRRQFQQPYAPPLGLRSDVTSAARAIKIPFGEYVLVVEQPIPRWSHPLLTKISELGDLPSGWDSYDARPIDPQCAASAVMFVLTLLDQHSPKPSIVPTNRGGIQLEWHRSGADLEIRIESPIKFHVWFEDERSGREKELTLSDNLLPLLPLLERISTGG